MRAITRLGPLRLGHSSSRRFLWRSAAAGFGRELEAWLDEIERELLPLDPVRAHVLAEAFLRSDEGFFEQADDSDGAIGDAIRAGCRLWLRTAKAQPKRDAAGWIDGVYALVSADEYGAREALLGHADLLFDGAGLRALAVVDAYNESEQRTSLYTMLDERLEVPFKTELLGVEVTVERVDLTDADEIVAICARGRIRQAIPILELPLPTPPPNGFEWIEAYRRWAGRR